MSQHFLTSKILESSRKNESDVNTLKNDLTSINACKILNAV